MGKIQLSESAKKIIICNSELKEILEDWESSDSYKDLQEYLEAEADFNKYLEQKFCCGIPIN